MKWAGGVSDGFAIYQGVRQGGILSPFLYKSYLNPCLMDLKHNRLGAMYCKIYIVAALRLRMILLCYLTVKMSYS